MNPSAGWVLFSIRSARHRACYRMLPCRCLCWAKSGSTVGGNFHFFKDRKSVILEVWAAPGALEALPKGGGLRPLPFARVSGAPGAREALLKGGAILGVWASPPTFWEGLPCPRGRPDPQNGRSPILIFFQNFIAIQSAATYDKNTSGIAPKRWALVRSRSTNRSPFVLGTFRPHCYPIFDSRPGHGHIQRKPSGQATKTFAAIAATFDL